MDRPNCEQCDKPRSKAGKTPGGATRWRCTRCKTSTTGSDSAGFDDKGYDPEAVAGNAARIRDSIKGGQKRFVITCAANNSPVMGGFLDSLETYASYNDAELIVLPVHYKNVSLYTAGQQYKKSWSDRVSDYLIDEEINLGGGVVVDGDTKIQATAANPLEGLHDIGGTKWRIFGHPQIAMQPVAMPGGMMPKRVYTSGAVTKKSYSRTKAGKKASFHHVAGALVVEVVGRKAFVRNVNADSTGGFYDLDKYYTPGKVYGDKRIKVLATGDEHVKFFDKKVRKATYDAENSIAKTLRPEIIVRQDVLDAYTVSHHHEKSPLKQYQKHVNGDNDAREELDEVVKFILDTTPEGAINAIASANHHDHLDKWLDRADAKRDHVNAHLILELQKAQREAIDRGECPAALRLYLEPRLPGETLYLDRNTPFVPNPGNGADYSQHGDVGVNGSRGSAAALSKATLKMVIGHSHGARIVKGVYQVGKSTGRLEYENGLSDHTNTHCIEYANGKRALIDIIAGKWRAEP